MHGAGAYVRIAKQYAILTDVNRLAIHKHKVLTKGMIYGAEWMA